MNSIPAPTPQDEPRPQVVDSAPIPVPVPVPQTLVERLEVDSWAARQWVHLIEAAAEPETLEPGIEISRRRRGPTLRVAPGEVSALVPDPPRARRTVSFLTPVIEHEHWERAAKAAAAEPVLSARLIAGEFPPEIDRVCAASELRLTPGVSQMSVRRGRARLEWDENVCAAAIVFAKRLDEDPGLLLTFRGMTPEAFRELVRQRAALASSGGKGAAAYAQRPPIGPDQEPGPLEMALDSFWSAGPELGALETPIRAPQYPHSLLRRLGASPFEQAQFPLIGLLATCYDLMTEAEVRRASGADAGAEDDTAV